ncbi:SDR family oxidoreductase [Subtercola lobariae]|uniref:Epimerase n=1 Tax=Subtercola lobariae TaxID=1588641 RepID=A0A917B2M4_9MICO|nr:NmrA family NAD(P)-binding protein [Subtercola lobariae]GGF15721.1 epimerase [Subtercola lobariae]
MILVTSASGNQGKLLLPKLLQRGLEVRASVRSEASAARLRELGVHDVIVGDIADPEMQRRAVRGVEKIYHIAATVSPGERAMGFGLIDAAREAGVSHFVFSSVLHAIASELVQHEIKRDIEEHLLASGLEFTILQPSNYMSPIKLRSVFEHGVFELMWSLDRSQSVVDLDDVTDVAVMALTDTARHAAATYELVAPGRFTAHQLGEIISRVVERPIEVREIDSEAFAVALLGAGDLSTRQHEVNALQTISGYNSAHDFVGNPNVLTWLLGREPTSYEQFVRREWDARRAAVQPGVSAL